MNTFMEKHPSMVHTIRIFLVCVLLALAVNAFGVFRKDAVSLEIEGSVFSISFHEEELIQFTKDEIVSAELLDTLNMGSAVRDMSEDGYFAGEWENDVWGSYTLCVKQSIEKYVVLRTDEQVFVFNYSNAATTEGICNALLAW